MKSLTQCIALLEKNALCKKIKMKKAVIQEFVVHVALVLLGGIAFYHLLDF